MAYNIYLSGEIHTSWRTEIINSVKSEGLDVEFSFPELNHDLSDNCGSLILGSEDDRFWVDHKSSKINFIRTRKLIKEADIVVVRFGENYKQWNAAFDAGYSVALNKSLIVIHSKENRHALKEVDAMALAVLSKPSEVSKLLKYVVEGSL